MEMGNDLNYKWIVYQTTCLINNKIYIGVHKTENPDIFDGYLGGGYKIGYVIKNPKTAYARALKKYGYKNFIRTIIKTFDSEQDAYNFEAQIVDITFIKRRDTYNTALGGQGGASYKTFYQYDLNGNFIKKWDSREELLQYYKCETDSNKFNRAIKNRRNVYNSYWTTAYVDHLDMTKYRLNKFTEIYKFDKNGNLLETYTSAVDAAKQNNTSVSSIYDCLHKKRSIKDCFYSKTKTDIFDIIKTVEENIYTDKTVSIYSLDGKLIKTFLTKKELSKFLKSSVKKITESIKNNTPINNYLINKGFSEQYCSNTTSGLKVNQYDIDGNFIRTWDTIAQCAKEYPKVRLVLKGIYKQTHGFVFKICK